MSAISSHAEADPFGNSPLIKTTAIIATSPKICTASKVRITPTRRADLVAKKSAVPKNAAAERPYKTDMSFQFLFERCSHLGLRIRVTTLLSTAEMTTSSQANTKINAQSSPRVGFRKWFDLSIWLVWFVFGQWYGNCKSCAFSRGRFDCDCPAVPCH